MKALKEFGLVVISIIASIPIIHLGMKAKQDILIVGCVIVISLCNRQIGRLKK
jgi:hypothetical protein